LSRAEEITNEVRKLVFTCRSLEAQLQQSVPKKLYQETVAKMQANIDSLSGELASTKSELEKSMAVAQRVEGLEAQVSSQGETISSNTKTIDSLTAKLIETEPYVAKYAETIARNQELESRISSMVEATAYTALQTRCSELETQIAGMVPRESFEAVQTELANSVQNYEELQRRLEQMVPRDQLNAAENRISELEKTLAESVPKADFDELAGKIARITKEAIELASRASAAIGLESSFPVEGDPVANDVPEVGLQTPQLVETPPSPDATPSEITGAHVDIQSVESQTEHNVPASPAPETSFVEQAPTTETVTAETQSQSQEISEVQSKLSEISTAIETGASTVESPQIETVVEPEKGFRFSNTDFCARSGLEFLEDLEKVDLSVVAAHCQNGDFERWFKDVLADETAAESIQRIRESNLSGEEMRALVVAAIAPRYRT
jgi:HPt (histidine-containing phosphotransfer) domain-containing protein